MNGFDFVNPEMRLSYTQHARERMADPSPSEISKQTVKALTKCEGNLSRFVKSVDPRGISPKLIERVIRHGEKIRDETTCKHIGERIVVITDRKSKVVITTYELGRKKRGILTDKQKEKLFNEALLLKNNRLFPPTMKKMVYRTVVKESHKERELHIRAARDRKCKKF